MIDWTKHHTEAFIEKHIAEVDWTCISCNQKLSEKFIERHADKVDWEYISRYQKLSEKFIEDHAHEVDWRNIALYQDISAEFVLRNRQCIESDRVRVDEFAAYVFLSFHCAEGLCDTREIPKKLQCVQVTKAQPDTSEINMDYIKDHAAELYNKYAGSSDNVNSPAHYQTHELECLVEMAYIFGEEALLHFAQCCAWKYRYRAGSKDSAEEDLKKSDFYTALARWLKQGGHIESFLKHRRKNS